MQVLITHQMSCLHTDVVLVRINRHVQAICFVGTPVIPGGQAGYVQAKCQGW